MTGTRQATPSDRSYDQVDRYAPRRAPAGVPRTRVLQLTIVLLPTVMLLVMGFQRRWVAEDAFINVRIVENLLAGHGPVFNLGERVEAYTNPLWVGVLTLWGLPGLPIETGAWSLGLLGAVAGLVAAISASRRLDDLSAPERSAKSPGLQLPLGALVFVAIPVVWDFATSGLETGLAFAWLGGCFWLLTRLQTRRAASTMSAPIVIALLISLGPLIRPDLVLFSLTFGLALLALCRLHGGMRAFWRRVSLLVLALVVLPVAYQVFRMGYFAALVPNTALAKEASLAHWGQGWEYLRDFTDTYWLWLPLSLLMIAWAGRVRLAASRASPDLGQLVLLIAPVAGGMLHALYVIRVGGDFMHGRLLLPSLFGLLLPVMSIRWPLPRTARLRSWLPLAGGGVLLLWVITCALWLRVPYAGTYLPGGFSDERGFYSRHSIDQNPISVEDYAEFVWVQDGWALRDLAGQLSANATPMSVLSLHADADLLRIRDDIPLPDGVQVLAVRPNIGLLGVAAGLDVRIIDLHGLSDPLAARMELLERGRPGHEKVISDTWILAQYGAIDAATSPEIQAAGRALACEPLGELRSGIEAPLTSGRFLDNIRLAWETRNLRIPADPVRAVQELC